MTAARVITETIPSALAGQRIDRVVAMVAGVSRSQALTLLEAGMVTVSNAVPDKPSQRVEVDDVVVIEVHDLDDSLEADASVPITVVYADDDVVVVDKQAGLVVHPGSGVTDGTLIQGLLSRFPALGELAAADPDSERPGVVHRIDRGTSGLLVVALNEDAYRHLVGQFSSRSVGRLYTALVVGDLESDAGLIDAPLGRSPRDPIRRAVVTDGKAARTQYRVIHRFTDPRCSLVECRLETGRTHQIRAHFTAIDHPIVGDDRYGGSRLGLPLERPFLHAAELRFEHPRTGETMRFESALPDDLAVVVSRLETESGRTSGG
ncbi:MAG: RluA family pseudouridine synthase [Acidimicrobiia bacterium]|nr:RluA family pseudouridine synthase [Acidimicrobiia bacterium]